MTSLILITMDNGRGHCAHWQSCKVPNQTHRGMKKIRKMYAIKQIKICAEYRDMLPRPWLDLSGTPGLRPIGLSPGSWQTSLGLGSMSRYSAQILICITHSTQRLGPSIQSHTWHLSVKVVYPYKCESQQPGSRFNIKNNIQVCDSHYNDKTVMILSYLYKGNYYAGEAVSLYWDGPLCLIKIGKWYTKQPYLLISFNRFSIPSRRINSN